MRAGEEPDAKLRNVVDTEYNPRPTLSVPAGRMLDEAVRDKAVSQTSSYKEKTLDSWLDEEEEEGSDETETEEDEDETEEEDSEEESEEGTEEEESDDENERLVR